MNETVVLRVRKKGITVIPKRLREEAGIEEDSKVKAKVLPEKGGILLQPLVRDPVRKLENLLPASAGGPSSVASIRKLRRKMDRELFPDKNR